MQKLTTLLAHIKDANAIAPERIEALVESGETEFSGSRAGPDLLLYRLRYTAVVELWGAAGYLTQLLALVQVWLAENGGDAERNFLAGFSGEPVDDRRSDITLRFELEEDVRYIPAEPGYTGADKIAFAGDDWKPGTAVADLVLTVNSLVVEIPA